MADPWDRLHLRMWEVTSKRLGRVPVVFGALSTHGMFDRKTEVVLNEEVLSVENALTVKTSELGGLQYGDLITVNGAEFKVRHEPMRIGDGLLCVVPLEEIENVSSISLIMTDTVISSATIIMAGT